LHDRLPTACRAAPAPPHACERGSGTSGRGCRARRSPLPAHPGARQARPGAELAACRHLSSLHAVHPRGVREPCANCRQGHAGASGLDELTLLRGECCSFQASSGNNKKAQRSFAAAQEAQACCHALRIASALKHALGAVGKSVFTGLLEAECEIQGTT